MNRGATAGELATVVGMGRKTAEYHLHYLVRVGQLRIDRVAGAPKRFALHSVARPSPEPLPLGASVLARIHGRPGASATEIAQELGVPRLRVDGHVKDLLVDGRVTSRVEAGRRRLYPA
jgi:predicted transcriptional regulator